MSKYVLFAAIHKGSCLSDEHVNMCEADSTQLALFYGLCNGWINPDEESVTRLAKFLSRKPARHASVKLQETHDETVYEYEVTIASDTAVVISNGQLAMVCSAVPWVLRHCGGLTSKHLSMSAASAA